MADDVVPLEEQLESIERRFGSWEAYKESFCKLAESQRQAEIFLFDKALDLERATPTRTFSSYLQKRRELTGLDNLLRNVSR
jgi:hypothetical protein